MVRICFAWPALVCLCLLASLSPAASGGDLLVDSGQRLGNEATWAVALGDIDGDGDLDAVAANFDVGAIVWLNDGAGCFVDSGQRLAVGVYVALADLDMDGALDVLLGSWDVAPSVWWNDGTGTFLQGRRLTGVAGCMALGVGDLNGDELPDVYVGTEMSDCVFLNASNRGFADSGQRLGRAPTGGVAFGDMDGDGDLDVVAAGWDEPGYVWANDGTGHLTELCSFDAIRLHIHGAVLADYDGDGDLDAFFAVAGRIGGLNVWRNDGAGRLTPAAFDLGSNPQQAIAVADLNLDGHLDITLAIGSGGSPSPSLVWLGADSAFVDSGIRIGEAFAGGLAVGDLDGDGDEDLFVGFLSLLTGWDYLPHPNQVWINTTKE
jgi:hypothetical protein